MLGISSICLLVCLFLPFASTAAMVWRTGFYGVGMFATEVESLSPEMRVTSSNDFITIQWPTATSNLTLETICEFPASNGWAAVTNLQAEVGGEAAVTLPVTNTQQFYRLEGPYTCFIPIFSFAIFYNELLEFTWSATMTVRGRVHANADIYVGSSSDLSFSNTVTAGGMITNRSWAGRAQDQYVGSINYGGNPQFVVNAPKLALPIGTNNTSDTLREIIHVPPPDEDANSPMGQQRFYNKAGMALLVSNTAAATLITAAIKHRPTDSNPIVLQWSNSTPFFMSNNIVFADQRENKWMRITQIDMDRLRAWLNTNEAVAVKYPSGNPLNILYVGDFRSTNSTTNTAVRLVNGRNLPPSPTAGGRPTGFTVATPNPLYVLGHYNCTNSAHLGTTNTSSTVPAGLVSDALTILSGNWQDSKSTNTLISRTATSTTVNAAILTGTVYSQGAMGISPYSGGVPNLPRLLEDWGNGSSSIVLTLNTSIVNLFSSARATAPFQNAGVYYYAPTRQFNFDYNFTDPAKLPPGTPLLEAVLPADLVTLPHP